MKNVLINFKWEGSNSKKVHCKPIVLPVIRQYLSGAVQVPSGDVYQATTDHNHKDKAFYLATA